RVCSTPFPYTTLFRSVFHPLAQKQIERLACQQVDRRPIVDARRLDHHDPIKAVRPLLHQRLPRVPLEDADVRPTVQGVLQEGERSEEHTSELQSPCNL